MSTIRPSVDFQTVFCKRFGYPMEQFVRRFFWKCVPPRVRPLAVLTRVFMPGYFERDLGYLRRIGRSASLAEIAAQAGAIPFDRLLIHGFARRYLHLRISSRRVMHLARELMAQRVDEGQGQGAQEQAV
jgi:hypothetical protein